MNTPLENTQTTWLTFNIGDEVVIDRPEHKIWHNKHLRIIDIDQEIYLCESIHSSRDVACYVANDLTLKVRKS